MNPRLLTTVFAILLSLMITSNPAIGVEPGIYLRPDKLPKAKVIDGKPAVRPQCPYQTGQRRCIKVKVTQSWIRSCLSGTGDAVSFVFRLYSQSGKLIGTGDDWARTRSDEGKNKKGEILSFPEFKYGNSIVKKVKVVKAVCVTY